MLAPADRGRVARRRPRLLSRALYGPVAVRGRHQPGAARMSGVPVDGWSLSAYVSAARVRGDRVAPLHGRLETGTPVLGQRILLDVVGAAVIGGVSLFGGKGKVLWTVFGVLFLTVIDKSLQAAGPVDLPRSSRQGQRHPGRRAHRRAAPPPAGAGWRPSRIACTHPAQARALLDIDGLVQELLRRPGAARASASRSRPGRGARPRRRERRRQVDDHEHPRRRPPAGRRPHAASTAADYRPRGRATRRAQGIAFIHQELNLFSNLTIAENLFIAGFPTRRSRVSASSTGGAPRPRRANC